MAFGLRVKHGSSNKLLSLKETGSTVATTTNNQIDHDDRARAQQQLQDDQQQEENEYVEDPGRPALSYGTQHHKEERAHKHLHAGTSHRHHSPHHHHQHPRVSPPQRQLQQQMRTRQKSHASSTEISPASSSGASASSAIERSATFSDTTRTHRGGSVARYAKSSSGSSYAGSEYGGASGIRSTKTGYGSVEILQKGYLTVKRGLLKGSDKRFYFVAHDRGELFCCKDETAFNLWFASGWPLPTQNVNGNADDGRSTHTGLHPIPVCTVLRADRAGDASGNDRAIAILAVGSTEKCVSMRYVADTTEQCDQWIRALHSVQVNKRPAGSENDPSTTTLPTEQVGTMGMAAHSRHRSSTVLSTAGRAAQGSTLSPSALSSSAREGGAERAVTPQRSNSKEDAAPTPSSSRSSDTSDPSSVFSSNMVATNRQHRGDSVASISSTSAATSAGNVVLFVPATGSAISVSNSKMTKAKAEMEQLIAKGAKRPSRGKAFEKMKDNQEIMWRYGAPEYILSDLEYAKYKEREHENTPLESYVEECCQSFLLEATHKAVYNQWRSVRQDYFYLQVNDGVRIPGSAINENDMFGLLYVNDADIDADMELKEGEAKDPRAILAEAFTEGFPMEILQVYTQPPQCYFHWRHWGPFTGRYKGVKGDSSRIEVRGFGQMQIDSNRMLSLRLFFKQKELFEKLNDASSRLRETQGEVRTRRVSSATKSPVLPVTASVAAPDSSPLSNPSNRSVAPATRITKAHSVATYDMRTSDIMAGLAGFTIASQNQQQQMRRKKTVV